MSSEEADEGGLRSAVDAGPDKPATAEHATQRLLRGGTPLKPYLLSRSSFRRMVSLCNESIMLT